MLTSPPKVKEVILYDSRKDEKQYRRVSVDDEGPARKTYSEDETVSESCHIDTCASLTASFISPFRVRLIS